MRLNKYEKDATTLIDSLRLLCPLILLATLLKSLRLMPLTITLVPQRSQSPDVPVADLVPCLESLICPPNLSSPTAFRVFFVAVDRLITSRLLIADMERNMIPDLVCSSFHGTRTSAYLGGKQQGIQTCLGCTR